MWMYASDPKEGVKGISCFYEGLIEMLWKMFPLHSELHQRWRMHLFMAGASLECEYTKSGYVTNETKSHWDLIEQHQNDNYLGVPASHPNVAVAYPPPENTFF